MAEDSKSQIGVSLLLDKPELSADPRSASFAKSREARKIHFKVAKLDANGFVKLQRLKMI